MKPMLINRLMHLEELVILSIYRESMIGKQEYQIVVLLYIVHQPSCCSTSLSLQFPTASHEKLLNNLSFSKCLYEDSSKYELNLMDSLSSLFFQICVWCRGKSLYAAYLDHASNLWIMILTKISFFNDWISKNRLASQAHIHLFDIQTCSPAS